MNNLQVHNVLTGPTKTVYLNEPMNKTPEEEDKTEPLESSGNEQPTSAPLTTEEETYKKRFDDATKYIRELKASNDAQIADLKTQLIESTTKSTTQEMPRTPEEWKVFQEKYPELAANMLTAAMMVAKQSNTIVEQKLKQLDESTKALNAREGENELKKYHPDFDEIRNDPRFHEWFKVQMPEIKTLIQSPNPKVIAKGLDMFKDYAGIKSKVQKVEAKKDATREINTPNRVKIGEGQKRIYSSGEIWKMPITEFEKNQEDIKAAQYEGRIVG